MVNIGEYTEDPSELSLTPIIESASLMIPPALINTNNTNNNINNINNNSNTNSNNIAADNKNTNNAAGALTLTNSLRQQPKKPKTKSRPAFVMKLWTMLNDESNKYLIDWLPDGNTFLVSNRELFVQQILPKYFKHSNFASFVRQLNMYGWHKVQDATTGSLHSDEKWQFSNPNFKRGRPDLLEKIVRHKPQDESSAGLNDKNDFQNLSQINVGLLLEQLNTLKSNQLKITKELTRVRDDNELLWQELVQTREKNSVQNEKIERILQFLASIYGNKVKGLEDANHQQLTNINTNYNYGDPLGGDNSSSTTLNNRFQDLTPKPRLMLKQHRHVSNPSTDTTTPTDNGIELLDNSPIQEIVRSPQQFNSNTDIISTPNLQQIQPYRMNEFQPYSPETGFIPSPQPLTGVQPQVQPQGQSQGQSQNQDQIQPQGQPNLSEAPYINSPTSTSTSSQVLTRPKLSTHPSYKILSQKIEQQGQSIDDLISQFPEISAQTPGSTSADKFDVEDYLNNLGVDVVDSNELDDEDDDEIEEIQRGGNNSTADYSANSLNLNTANTDASTVGSSSGLKRKDVLEFEDDADADGEIEEIINPSKKRKSDQFV